MNPTLLSLLAALGLCAALAGPAMAQDHSGHTDREAPAAAGQEMMLTAGEVTRVDARGGKLTIRHEDIKNLDMPAMTMVFPLADPQQASQLKPGDSIRFRAEQVNGVLTLTRVERAQ
ncbi:hypothetical protein GCM10010975_15100 [Comamonas phosphati]|nr:hypothetical protein GCM10010975_15100 [Comamonas phosphati]